MDLLERETALATLAAALDDAAGGRGRFVVVAGEPGVGKTAVVTAALARDGGPRRVLAGACDPLLTPRALGPFHDIAHDCGGEVAEALRAPVRREDLVAALLAEMARTPPRVMVIEDVHWADEGTLDLLALLGRRVGRASGTLIVTLRPDQADDRLRATLGELPADAVRRIDLGPLREGSVAELARRAGRDPGDLHDATGGNPFYVTEVLASEGSEVPRSVRDAVLARARRLSAEARGVLEVVGVIPGRAEPRLIEDVLGAGAAGPLDECLGAGMLELDGDGLRFRHEIARSSVEAELSPLRRRELEARVLEALRIRPGVDPARIVHHARRAGDREAVASAAPEAARLASAAGAHLQAAEHLRAALEVDDGRDGSRRAALLEGLSYEAYLSGAPEEALAARREALGIRMGRGEIVEAGEDERWLSRLLWWAGRREESEAAACRAIALLEPLGPGHGLAMAYSTLAQLLMLAWRTGEALEIGRRAIAMAREIDDRETLSHALNNVGTALAGSDDPAGEPMLHEAFALASADGNPDNAVRALVNLSWCRVMHRRYAEAEDTIEQGLSFAQANELRAYHQYLLGIRAWTRLERGDWAGTEQDGRAVMVIDRVHPTISSHPGMVALGRLLVRRGDPEGRALLDDAWSRAVVAAEPQRILPAACACCERAWLEGDDASLRRFAAEARGALVAGSAPRAIGEALLWSWRAGDLDRDPASADEPARRAMLGDPRGAADVLDALGCPYEAADALWESDDEADLLRALATFDRLGARVPAGRVRARLRGAGRAVPAGPRPATRRDPDGLTPRQREILALLAEGETNAAIAARLVLSPRTVDHHVSAILHRLGVASRAAAARHVADMGTRRDTGAEDGQVAPPG